MLYSDIKAVDAFIESRLGNGQWVIAPSMLCAALGWPMEKSIESLSEIRRQNIHTLMPVMTALCDFCLSENIVTSQADLIIGGDEHWTKCDDCNRRFSCTSDNTRVYFKANPLISGKEATDDPFVDVRQ